MIVLIKFVCVYVFSIWASKSTATSTIVVVLDLLYMQTMSSLVWGCLNLGNCEPSLSGVMNASLRLIFTNNFFTNKTYNFVMSLLIHVLFF